MKEVQIMSPTQWYVRLGNEVVGPISQDELLELALRGGLTPETPVSSDRANWLIAGNVPGIVFRPAQPPQPTLLPSSATTQPRVFWWLGAGVVGTIAVVFCGGLLLGLFNGNSGSGSPSWATKYPQPVASPSPGGKSASQSDDAAPPRPDVQQTSGTGRSVSDWDYDLIPARSVGDNHDLLSSDVTSPRPSASLAFQCVDATSELVRLASTLPDETKAAMGFAAMATGTDVYAVRVSLRNTGSVPIRIYPQNIAVHFGSETAQVYTIANPSFLQPRVLQPGQSASGLVTYVARMEIGAAMRMGGGSLSYEDPTIQVTYK